MKLSLNIRIAKPSKYVRSILDPKQIKNDWETVLSVDILESDPNFQEIVYYFRQQAKKKIEGEFVSSLDVNFLWTPEELRNAKSFVVRPRRFFYNEVENEKTDYVIESAAGLGYKYVQKSSLILPNLKPSSTQMKYLSDGALVISKSLNHALGDLFGRDLSSLPVLKKKKEAADSMNVLDFCIANECSSDPVDSEWYQVVTTSSVQVHRINFDPLKFGRYRSEDCEPYDHIFPCQSAALSGNLGNRSAAFCDIGFGLLEGGLWRFSRPLVVSRTVYEVLKVLKLRHIEFDPFEF